MSKRQRVAFFLYGTFLMTIAVDGTFHFLGVKYEGTQAAFIGLVTMAVPAIVAIIIQKAMLKERVIEPLGLLPKWSPWYLVALLLPAAVALLTLAISPLFSGVSYDFHLTHLIEQFATSKPAASATIKKFADFPVPPVITMLLPALAAGASVNAIAALGEEIGWRGFLFINLSGNFWQRAAVTGAVWGVWHTPLILMGHNKIGPVPVTLVATYVFCFLWAFLFNYLREAAGSLLPCAVMHGTINALGLYAMQLTSGGTPATVGCFGTAGLIALAIVSALVLGLDSRRATPITRRQI